MIITKSLKKSRKIESFILELNLASSFSSFSFFLFGKQFGKS